MQLSITVEDQDRKTIDIIVNSEQKIKDALAILEDAGMIKMTNKRQLVWSSRRGQEVSTGSTFKEAGILYGDILTLGKRG